MLPNFFIVGAPKAGTTSLYHYLKVHQQIYMSPVKEPNYFSQDEIVAQNLYYKEKGIGNISDYELLFAAANNQKAIGEASVSYLWYPETAAKIKLTIPDAKIIIILRNPVERGFSHYLMDRRLGYVRMPYETIVERKGNHRLLSLYYQQYVELGLYYEQVKRYLDTFSKTRVKVYYYEDLRQMTILMKDLYLFLNVDNLDANTDVKHNTFEKPINRLVGFLYSQKVMRNLANHIFPPDYRRKVKTFFFDKGKKPELLENVKKRLLEIYIPDIKALEKLLTKDLSHWYGQV